MPLPAFIIPPPEDGPERKLVSDVKSVGWHAVHISADEQGPCFTFTVGFYYTFQVPEILVMGLRHEVSHELLRTAASQLKEGKSFPQFKGVSGFAEGYDCAFAPIKIEHYRNYLGFAMWFYRTLNKPFPALQLIWPDKGGRFPWEANYDTVFLAAQKALYEPP